MARALTPHPISGKVGKLIYSIRNGKQHVHPAPTSFKPKKHGPAYIRNKDEFAGAAIIAHDIYKHIKADKFDQHKPYKNHDKLGPIFRPYPQNYLTGHLKKKSDLDNKRRTKVGRWYAKQFTFLDAVNALKGLDLSQEEAPSGHISMTPIGPQHNPTAIKVQGMEHAARAIDQHGNAKLEFRFHMRQSRNTELQYEKETRKWHEVEDPKRPSSMQETLYHSQPTAWIPVEIIPKEGFTLPLPTGVWHEEDKYLTAVMIEWREIRTVGRRAIRLHKQGIVRIAALHAPIEDWTPSRSEGTPHSLSNSHSKPRDLSPSNSTRPKPQAPSPSTDPQAYIAQALTMLHQPPIPAPPK